MFVLLRKAIASILVESKLDDLKRQFPAGDVEDVARNDPSGQKLKYAQWMLKQLQKGHRKEDVYATVSYFDKNNVRFAQRDINSYGDLKDLEDEAKRISQTKSGRQQRADVKSEAPKVYEDDDFVVVRPDSKRSCMVYGSGTKWCITMGDASYYEEYTSANVVFYFVLSKKLDTSDPMSKVAAAVMRDVKNNVSEIEWYDAADKKLKKKSTRLHLKGAADAILNTIRADAAKRPMGLFAKLKNDLATPEEIMAVLDSADDDESGDVLRKAIAESPSTPPEALLRLANDENTGVRQLAAGNPSTPPEALARLASDEKIGVRNGAAGNPSTPSEALLRLASDESFYVRQAAAGNPATSPEALARLANDEHENVRLVVAKNPSTPSEALAHLANDEYLSVRHGVAKNPSTPPEALARLANDENIGVRQVAAGNPSTPPEALLRLASDKNAAVRQLAAGNPATPLEALAHLANDENNNVRWVAAKNPATPLEALAHLARDENEDVRKIAINALKKSKTESVFLLKKFINELLRIKQSV